MDMHNKLIYSCLALRIQRSSRCPDLLLFYPFHIVFLYPRSTKLNGCILVSLCWPVRPWTESCPLCILHSTSRTHFIFTQHINKLEKVCSALSFVKKIPKFEFWQFLKICTFHPVLCPCNVKSWFLIRVDIAATLNFLWWYLLIV